MSWRIVFRRRRRQGFLRDTSIVATEGEQIPLKPPIPATLAEAEQIIRHQKYETIYVFSASGDYLYGNNGSVDSVAVEQEYQTIIEGATCLHNHPTGKRFSPEDILFIRDLDPCDFRVITPTQRFRLVRPVDGWSSELIPVYSKWYTTYYHRYDKDRRRGKISHEKFSAKVFADALRQTVDELALTYTEEEL